MSRLTLGGRKRAGGKVHERLRQSEKENEHGNTQLEDLQRTLNESQYHTSYTPKYTYFLKNLIVL